VSELADGLMLITAAQHEDCYRVPGPIPAKPQEKIPTYRQPFVLSERLPNGESS
jgi:hypothetical protein